MSLLLTFAMSSIAVTTFSSVGTYGTSGARLGAVADPAVDIDPHAATASASPSTNANIGNCLRPA